MFKTPSHRWQVGLVLIALTASILAACGSPATPEATEPPATEQIEQVTATSQPSPAPTETSAPSPTPKPTEFFNPVSSSSVLNAGTQYFDPGAAIYVDGVYHMFPNAFTGWPARVDILHATSEDGIHWTYPNGQEPVFNEENVPYAGVAVLATSAIVADDGTWVLYFRTWESGGTLARSSMGRATAPDPDGPWTADAERVLQPGPDGAWDDVQAAPGSVLKIEDGYVMFYAGNKKAVGMATSPDGITWTKYNDPATSGPEFAASDPVFTVSKGGPAWDDSEVYQPRVVQSPEGFVMLYTGTGTAPGMGRAAHGMAISEDGIHWSRLPENPVLLRDSIRGGANLWFSELLYADDTYFLYFELAKDSQNSSTTVYLATHEGMLVP